MSRNRASHTAADLESYLGNALLGAPQRSRFDSPVRIHIHSIRHRLADPDGISAKAAIDGLVKAKILEDDSPEFVKEVSYSQEKGDPEKTIITITALP